MKGSSCPENKRFLQSAHVLLRLTYVGLQILPTLNAIGLVFPKPESASVAFTAVPVAESKSNVAFSQHLFDTPKSDRQRLEGAASLKSL